MRIFAPLAGLVGAISAHALHNCGATFAASEEAGVLLCFVSILVNWGGIMLLLVLIIATLQRHRKHLTYFLAQEVEIGTLGAELYQVACSLAARRRARFAALLSGNLTLWWHQEQFFSNCSKLAFRRYRHERIGGEALEQHIATLRSSVKAFAQKIAV
jgi:hypothetical protein